MCVCVCVYDESDDSTSVGSDHGDDTRDRDRGRDAERESIMQCSTQCHRIPQSNQVPSKCSPSQTCLIHPRNAAHSLQPLDSLRHERIPRSTARCFFFSSNALPTGRYPGTYLHTPARHDRTRSMTIHAVCLPARPCSARKSCHREMRIPSSENVVLNQLLSPREAVLR